MLSLRLMVDSRSVILYLSLQYSTVMLNSSLNSFNSVKRLEMLSGTLLKDLIEDKKGASFSSNYPL